MEKLQFIPNTILRAPHHSRPFLYDARYKQNNTRKPVIIFVHGFKGFKDWGPFGLMADRFAEQGFVFARLNLSHNGTTIENPLEFADLEAFGRNNFTTELDDLGTFISHLAEGKSAIPSEEADFNKLLIIGHSRGGGLAILKTFEDQRIRALATWAAINDIDQGWPEAYIKEWKEKGVQHIFNSRTGQTMPLYYQIVEDYYQNKERLDIPKAVKNLGRPHLIVHGTADETVPVEMAKEMAQWNPTAKLFLVKDADHTFGAKHPCSDTVLPTDMEKVIQETIAFFERHI